MAISLITGGSGDIGREIAYCFARHGYDVAVHYHTAQEEAASVAAKIRETFHVRAAAIQADLSSAQDVDTLFTETERQLGAPDILVNNAGIAQQRLFTELTDRQWHEMLDVNLTGAFYTCRRATAAMIRQKHGAIVNVSSIWGVAGGACEVHYSAAKAGMIGLTKALARELGPSGIRVNCVAPGVIGTKMNAIHSKAALDALAEETPLCRLGAPYEVAAAVYFLASEDASFITGQTLCVDGGFLQG